MTAAPSQARVPASSSAAHGSVHTQSATNTAAEQRSHPMYHAVWFAVNAAIVLAALWSVYSIGWEISTRRYLKGFSDAIVPATAPPEEKMEAILNWMANGPSRLKRGPDGSAPDRDPTDTLNYEALLKVCGTATNAFINLVDSGGLQARRLLLVDSNHMTKHVVAEVFVDGRWVIADPAYRILWRGADGKPFTREQLADPATFHAVTSGVRAYDPSYTFDHTEHIRVARVPLLGMPLRTILNHLVPGWEDSVTATLLVERLSFTYTIVSLLILLFLVLFRAWVRWFGEKRLGLHTPHMRQQFARAWHTFVNTAG